MNSFTNTQVDWQVTEAQLNPLFTLEINRVGLEKQTELSMVKGTCSLSARRAQRQSSVQVGSDP